MFEPLNQCLVRLASVPVVIDTDDLGTIQRFVILLYSRTCGICTVNEARKHLFAQSSRSLENIPPTEAALLQHCKRAVYQGSYVWGQTLQLSPVLPSPGDWRWVHADHGWQPYWTN